MDYYDVGKIVNTHGIKGEVRVLSTTTNPEERYYEGAPLIWFGKKGGQEELTVKTHRTHKNFDLLSFEGYGNVNEVEHFVGGTLRVSEDMLLELPENEFYIHEVVGSTVIDDDSGEEIGTIKEILSPGANDVWVVKRPNKKDLLLPYIEPVILDVDILNQVVRVHVMEGLDE
ncbi:16S rRNA processing protein RimM [Alkalibacterium subtropicum]|uniref:Ribosome maturation factor RimM n=1 Tax=Alkalibacterium subtropicum TaxID=753702 RepID=A0A1I1J930_9LACT|nr:ribosome maturation factor RimM [Alkalibacterium subtropicum]SFC45054.1 16S rRNA processing protein RimM [Alkalibacterium subtropicum]